MECRFCDTWNADDEHRCSRCGRRLSGSAGSAHPPVVMTAAAPQLIPIREPETERPPEEVRRPGSGYQPPLFHEMPRVMPMPGSMKPAAAPARKRTSRQAVRRADDNQQALEFVESPVPRTLPTSVESQIYCDARAATPMHRFTATAIDAGLVVAAFALFAGSVRLIAGPIELDKYILQAALGTVATLYLFYEALFCIAETETPGCAWMGLTLVDYDGKRPDRRKRLQRLASTVVSAGCILGVVWALLDEERLTWHDQISKTFPTSDAD